MNERTGSNPSLRDIDFGCVYALDRLRQTRKRLEDFAPQKVPERMGAYIVDLLRKSFLRGIRRLR